MKHKDCEKCRLTAGHNSEKEQYGSINEKVFVQHSDIRFSCFWFRK
jgi:hypothetical protein